MDLANRHLRDHPANEKIVKLSTPGGQTVKYVFLWCLTPGGGSMESITVVSLLDVISELFSEEISIAVSNTKEYIYYRPSKRIDLKIRSGDPLKEGTIAFKAIHSGQKISEFIDRFPFYVLIIMHFFPHKKNTSIIV
jgi:hypothetical protein